MRLYTWIHTYWKQIIEGGTGYCLGVWQYFRTLEINVAALEKMIGAFVYGGLGAIGSYVCLWLFKQAIKGFKSFWKYLFKSKRK